MSLAKNSPAKSPGEVTAGFRIRMGLFQKAFFQQAPNDIRETWGNELILSQIRDAKESAEDFGKDSLLSQIRTSDTGDTYLSMHQNRMVRILNETSDSAIAVFYAPKTDPADTDYEKIKKLKGEAKERAFTIANFLLTKYQK